MNTTIICSRCNKEIKPDQSGISLGYGQDKDGNKFCYLCCAELDREAMIQHGRYTLYLTTDSKTKNPKVCNWPNSLSFPVVCSWKGKHNWGLTTTFVRFVGPDGKIWSGKQIGDFSELCNVKRTKLVNCFA